MKLKVSVKRNAAQPGKKQTRLTTGSPTGDTACVSCVQRGQRAASRSLESQSDESLWVVLLTSYTLLTFGLLQTRDLKVHFKKTHTHTKKLKKHECWRFETIRIDRQELEYQMLFSSMLLWIFWHFIHIYGPLKLSCTNGSHANQHKLHYFVLVRNLQSQTNAHKPLIKSVK